jgi:hypothetical protein
MLLRDMHQQVQAASNIGELDQINRDAATRMIIIAMSPKAVKRKDVCEA